MKVLHPEARENLKRPRSTVACDSCCANKVKCDVDRPPCRRCTIKRISCTFDRPLQRVKPSLSTTKTGTEPAAAGNILSSFDSRTTPHVHAEIGGTDEVMTPSHSSNVRFIDSPEVNQIADSYCPTLPPFDGTIEPLAAHSSAGNIAGGIELPQEDGPFSSFSGNLFAWQDEGVEPSYQDVIFPSIFEVSSSPQSIYYHCRIIL